MTVLAGILVAVAVLVAIAQGIGALAMRAEARRVDQARLVKRAVVDALREARQNAGD